MRRGVTAWSIDAYTVAVFFYRREKGEERYRKYWVENPDKSIRAHHEDKRTSLVAQEACTNK